MTDLMKLAEATKPCAKRQFDVADTCPKCDGSGEVPLIPGLQLKCNCCDGKVRDWSLQNCTECHGRGWTLIEHDVMNVLVEWCGEQTYQVAFNSLLSSWIAKIYKWARGWEEVGQSPVLYPDPSAALVAAMLQLPEVQGS